MRSDEGRLCIKRTCWGVPLGGFRKCPACMRGKGPVGPEGIEEEE